MKILYSSDTHVYPGHLKRLLATARRLNPSAVIIGGDINPNWKGSIRESIAPHRQWFESKFLPQVREFRNERPEISFIADLGNDDIMAARPVLEKAGAEVVTLLHMRIIPLDDTLALVGYMCVSPTPFKIKDWEKPDTADRPGLTDAGVRLSGFRTGSGVETPAIVGLSDGTIEEDLDTLSSKLLEPEWANHRFLFVCHSPPRDSALDRTHTGSSVGSLAVRRFIERWGPGGRLLASLHGHIHESPWKTGRAVEVISGVPAFNVGQDPGALRALVFDSERVIDSARLVVTGPDLEPVVFDQDRWL